MVVFKVFLNLSVSSVNFFLPRSEINFKIFKKVKDLEQNETFYEGILDAKTGKRKIFFNLGPSNDWRKLLEGKIKIKLEKAFKNEMVELGYL